MKTFYTPSPVLLFATLVAMSIFLPRAIGNPVDLANVDLYAFKSIGIAGAVSEGEIAYKAIIGEKDAEIEFSWVFREGTSEAKAFALHGLHRLGSRKYAPLKKEFLESSPMVQYIAGCLICDLEAKEIISMIEKGRKKGDSKKKK